MKKLFLSLIAVVSIVGLVKITSAGWGGNNWENLEDVQVSTTNSPTNITNPTAVFLANPSKGNRDCYTKLSFSGDNFPAAGATIRLISTSSTTAAGGTLANATTFYNLTWSTGTVMDYWDFQNPLCNPTPGTTTWMTVSTGNYKVNANGFIRNR